MQPPLQLNNYFFPVINIVANPDWTPELAAKSGAPLVSCEVKTKRNEDNANVFQVTIELNIKSTLENVSQYDLNLVAVGFLTASDDLPNKEQNISITGASILYSATREFLLQILSRGPWPPIMLSPMAFGTAPEQPKPPKKRKK